MQHDIQPVLDILAKGGSTFAGAVAALVIVWRYAISPLAVRLLDMHESMAKEVSSALRAHAKALEGISMRLQRIEERVESFFDARRGQ